MHQRGATAHHPAFTVSGAVCEQKKGRRGKVGKGSILSSPTCACTNLSCTFLPAHFCLMRKEGRGGFGAPDGARDSGGGFYTDGTPGGYGGADNNHAFSSRKEEADRWVREHGSWNLTD